MIKKYILLFMVLFSMEIYGKDGIENKLVIDYGNFLNIEGQKEIHSILEYLHDQTGIYVTLVTVKNMEDVNINTSISDYVNEINKTGNKDIIIFVRDKDKYGIYLSGGVNNKVISDKIDGILKLYMENQSEVEYFYTEFMTIFKFLAQNEQMEVMKKYNTKNIRVEKYKKGFFYSMIGFLALVSGAGIYLKKRREYMIKIGAVFK